VTIRATAIAAALALATCASAQQPEYPLRPADRSSPRATLHTFLDAGDRLERFLVESYVPRQSREGFAHLVALTGEAMRCLDLAHVAQAARPKVGRAAAVALYETLGRIPLPPPDEIPDAAQMAARPGAAANRWTIPDTEITLVRVESGPHAGDFLFSPETVARAEEFHRRTNALPQRRPMPIADVQEFQAAGGGWMVPVAWVRAAPPWLRTAVLGQAAWKWIGLVVVVSGWLLVAWLAHRLGRGADRHGPLAGALRRFALPLTLVVATPVAAWLLLAQVNLIGEGGVTVGVTATAITFLAAAWTAWRAAPVLAEVVLTSPHIARESIDAHLVRMTARLAGIAAALVLLGLGADRLGLPVYGIVAGLGVGGIAVALAAQPTLENLIAGMNLFADKPVRVGDKCKAGDANGKVEAIGIRSTRIRNADRSVTTIPNGALSRMAIVNQSLRDRMQLQFTLGLLLQTPPATLRAIRDGLEAMLLATPGLVPGTAKARVVGVGTRSVDVELQAMVDTVDGDEFARVREQVLLQALEIVERAGASLAPPA
jgi:MscS family membrane protein